MGNIAQLSNTVGANCSVNLDTLNDYAVVLAKHGKINEAISQNRSTSSDGRNDPSLSNPENCHEYLSFDIISAITYQ
jgi:hypothetical protein